MNLDELQSVRDRERQTDKPQQLRESFYADVGSFVEQLRTERDRAAERHGSPYADEVMRLTDEIDAAQQLVEDIHERRIGKVVKAASLEAAALSPEVDGLTTEEQALFDDLVADIEHHREDVLDTVEGETPTDTGATADDSQTGGEATGIDAADVMGTDTADEGVPSSPPPESADRQRSEHPNPGEMRPDTAPEDRPGGGDPTASGPARTDGNGSRPDEPSADGRERRPTDPGGNASQNGHSDETRNGHADVSQNGHSDGTRNGHSDQDRRGHAERGRADVRGAASTERGEDGSDGVGETPGERVSDAPGWRGDRQSGTGGSVEAPGAGTDIERERVLVTRDVDTFVGSDTRDYDLAADDVVTLPATNAEILVQRDAARRL